MGKSSKTSNEATDIDVKKILTPILKKQKKLDKRLKDKELQKLLFKVICMLYFVYLGMFRVLK